MSKTGAPAGESAHVVQCSVHLQTSTLSVILCYLVTMVLCDVRAYDCVGMHIPALSPFHTRVM